MITSSPQSQQPEHGISQVPVEGQDIHLIVQLVLTTHQGTCHLLQVVDPGLNIHPESSQVIHSIQHHRGTDRHVPHCSLLRNVPDLVVPSVVQPLIDQLHKR